MTEYDLRKAQKEIRDGKPTIEEIKKEFRNKFLTNKEDVDLWWIEESPDPVDIWNFFERYLK